MKTYGELVTAIVNPSHKLADGYAKDQVSEDGVSNMYVYNGFMTVQELTDLVMFLQPHYDVVPPQLSVPHLPLARQGFVPPMYGLQYCRHADAAVRLLVVFHDRNQRTACGNTRTIQRMQ